MKQNSLPRLSPRILKALAATALLSAASLFAPAQEPPPGTVITSKIFVVNVFVTATSGKTYVRDLTREDFVVLEDGVPQEIKFFNNLSETKDTPLTIAMLVDTSASVADKLGLEVATASAFLKHILRKNKDMASILEFHSEVILTQDFTDDQDRLDRALHKLRPGGNTSLYDAVYLASEEKLKYEAGRKIIVVLSDGEDTASSITQETALKSAQKNDVLIYGLGVRSPNYLANFGALQDFCKATGGQFFMASVSRESLEKVFAAIMENINHQYQLAYEPKRQDRDGKFRNIKITLKRKGLKLQHRQGYFSPES